MKVVSVTFSCFEGDGIMKHIGKWSDTSHLYMAVLKTVSQKEFVSI